MALVHVAMFDAVNAIDRSYEPYHAHVHASRAASMEAAAAQAAHDTLVALYPSRQAIYDAELAEDLAGIPADQAAQGIAIGQEVARQILALRSNDGSSADHDLDAAEQRPGHVSAHPAELRPGRQRPCPVHHPVRGREQLPVPPRPAPGPGQPGVRGRRQRGQGGRGVRRRSAGVDRDGNGLPDRTADQTLVAELWRVALGNHTVWNRIAQDQAAAHDLSLPETARLFALMNMALNDGLQTSNESKYHYELWRPITAIQRADEDGNPATEGEPTWMTEHPTTPPYPAYASNASTIGAACATVLADVFGSNDIPFEVNWAPGRPPVVRRASGPRPTRWPTPASTAASTSASTASPGRRSAATWPTTSWTTSCEPAEREAAAGVFNGELVVVGTDGGDVLNVVRSGTDLVVWANGVQLGQFAAPVSGIVMDGGDGNDLILISQPGRHRRRDLRRGRQRPHFGRQRRRPHLRRGRPGHPPGQLRQRSSRRRRRRRLPVRRLRQRRACSAALGDDWLFGGPGLDVLDGGPGRNRLFHCDRIPFTTDANRRGT